MAPRRKSILIASVAILILIGIVSATVTVVRSPKLTTKWRSDTDGSAPRSQFPMGVFTGSERSLVFAPIGSGRNGTNCGLFALNGDSGDVVWKHQVTPPNCDVNPVTAPTVADFDGDGQIEVLVVSHGGKLTAHDPASGRPELQVQFDIPHGNTRPIVRDLTGAAGRDIIVTTIDGIVRVIGPNGDPRWRESVGGHMFATPQVRDFDADGRPGLVVPAADGGLVLLSRNGTIVWHRNVSSPTDAVTWMTSASLDGDASIEIVASTANGSVVAVDGRTGAVQWHQSVGALAAVRAVFDGDSDGVPEVYAVGDRAILRMLNGTTGAVEWRRPLTNRTVQMTPPPVAGDVDADGSPELVVVTNDGTVAVLEPASGDVLATNSTNDTVFAPPTVANIDQDESAEILVLLANGRVLAYDYQERLTIKMPSKGPF